MSDRLLLYERAGGKCEECGRAIAFGEMQADHEAPWSLTRRTFVFEMRALCGPCNREKSTHMAMSDRFRLARMMSGWDWDRIFAKSRPGQRLCLAKMRDVFGSSRKQTFTAILPMGYGKSHLMRAMGMGLIKDGLACAAFVIAPGETLVDQMVEPSNMREFQRIFELGFTPDARRLIAQEANPIANGEHLRAMTQQWLVQNLDYMKRFVRWCIAEFGKPPVFLIDECHNTSQANKWGNAVIELIDAGALMVLVTATAYRTDRELIPGFQAVAIGSEAVQRTQTRFDVEREQFLRDHLAGTKKFLRLEADFEYPLSECMNEKPAPIGMITRVPIDVQINDLGQSKMLSEMSPNEVRKNIGQWVCSDVVIRGCIAEMLTWLRRWHDRGISVGALVFCTNDLGGNRGGNAKDVERVIRELAPGLSVDIATMAESGDGKSAAARDKIRRFAGTKDTAGVGDVLLVKQMGGQGLDSARIKIVVDLSATRTPNSLIQRIGRCNRPLDGLRSGLYITPDDVISRGIFDLWITDEGGSVPVYELEVEWTEVVDAPDSGPQQVRIYLVEDTSQGEMQDLFRNTAGVSVRPRIDAMLDEFPFLLDSVTPPQLAKMALRYNLGEQAPAPSAPVPPHMPQRTTAELIEEYRRALNAAVTNFVNDSPFKPRAADKKAYHQWLGPTKAQVWNTIKREVGVESHVQLKEISDLDVLEAMKQAASRLSWEAPGRAAD